MAQEATRKHILRTMTTKQEAQQTWGRMKRWKSGRGSPAGKLKIQKQERLEMDKYGISFPYSGRQHCRPGHKQFNPDICTDLILTYLGKRSKSSTISTNFS
ncbi:unnamed protein product [Dovyalis caffra]|uniref:Uncharacterized protein n=1 Tax=Dovyalis caffra TaxID=77055 RepID=A0AAV1RS77_9ROSI|nr:unnamed protein product [Dovyalis caffra]